jgi:hypothetical protein
MIPSLALPLLNIMMSAAALDEEINSANKKKISFFITAPPPDIGSDVSQPSSPVHLILIYHMLW